MTEIEPEAQIHIKRSDLTQSDDDVKQQMIKTALIETPFVESNFFTTQLDCFCSGLVTKVFHVQRRLYSFPFETCIISHSGIVCETTRRRAYMVEFCEGFPILTHDVTNCWSFVPTSKWGYANYTYARDVTGFILPVVSYNVQYIAKLFQCSADVRGEYILSGNNCHVVQEQVRYSLGQAELGTLHYGSYCNALDIEFQPLEEMKPFYYM